MTATEERRDAYSENPGRVYTKPISEGGGGGRLFKGRGAGRLVAFQHLWPDARRWRGGSGGGPAEAVSSGVPKSGGGAFAAAANRNHASGGRDERVGCGGGCPLHAIAAGCDGQASSRKALDRGRLLSGNQSGEWGDRAARGVTDFAGEETAVGEMYAVSLVAVSV